MYYIAKIAQAIGLTIIFFDFIRKFPHLMSPKIFLLGIALFLFGWVINHFMLQK